MLCRKIKTTHKVKYINIKHRANDYTMLCDHTLVLMEFNKTLNVTNKITLITII